MRLSMLSKAKLRKLVLSIGIKGIICLFCLGSIGFALVTYTTAVTITPVVQLSPGVATEAFNVYVNDQNKVRYVPGGTNGESETTLNTGDTTTYAFKVVTDAAKVCAIEVNLQTAMDEAKFSSFTITVLSSTGGAWSAETLYVAATGSTTKASINGLTPGDTAYIHQATGTTKYYEIQITYSYDIVDDTAQIVPTFVYTPYAQDGFT